MKTKEANQLSSEKTVKQLGVLFIGLAMLLTTACSSGEDVRNQVRAPVAAGSFYPKEAEELINLLKKAFLNSPAPALEGDLKALLLPHAGFVYSGMITVLGMKALEAKKIDTVYIIGTSHYADVGGALIWQGKAFQTPLGNYPVASEKVRDLLRSCPYIHLSASAWEKEHSVEIQIPFLQRVAPQAKLVPMLMGTSTWEECWGVAEAIAKQAAQQKAIVIASSDLSHYPTAADATVIDRKTLEAVTALDPYALEKYDQEFLAKGIPNLGCTYCGISAVKTTLLAANFLGANRGQLLYYANSGDITEEKNRVVGYAAVAFIEDKNKPPLKIARPQETTDIQLNQAQKDELLNIARAAITEGLASGVQLMPTTSQPELLTKRPVFVTLKRDGQLQGCIGMTEARLPLYQAVAQMACAAAFQDPRFQPLKAEELPDTEIEISVLTPLQRIQDPKEIVLGIHGVVVKRGTQSGLFLPQVATETGWSKEEFLNNLCVQKAQLPADSWQDKKTELYVFRVISFRQPAPGR